METAELNSERSGFFLKRKIFAEKVYTAGVLRP